MAIIDPPFVRTSCSHPLVALADWPTARQLDAIERSGRAVLALDDENIGQDFQRRYAITGRCHRAALRAQVPAAHR